MPPATSARLSRVCGRAWQVPLRALVPHSLTLLVQEMHYCLIELDRGRAGISLDQPGPPFQSFHLAYNPLVIEPLLTFPCFILLLQTFEPLGENLLSLTQRCVKENKLAAAALAKQNRSNLTPSGRKTAATFASLIDLAVPPALVKCIAKQILLGMDYLHSECKLIHTDLKPENVLVALEDVEEVVRMELEMFPTSESIKVRPFNSSVPDPRVSDSPAKLLVSGERLDAHYVPAFSPSSTDLAIITAPFWRHVKSGVHLLFPTPKQPQSHTHRKLIQ